MIGRLKQPASTALVASLIACAIDLGLSAANGYFIRVDKTALLALEWAGVAAVSVAAILGLCAAAVVVRRSNVIASAPAAVCLAGAWAPLALILLWRHRDTTVLAALAISALLILCLFAIEVSRRSPLPIRPFGFVAILASIGAIGWTVAVPYPGRDLLAGAGDPVAAPTGQSDRPNLLFIVLDTMRADHIGAYGYPRPTTPWLDQFANSATLFENVVASSSYTLPTHATLFTGLYAETHGAVEASHDHGGVSLNELNLLADWAKVLPLSGDATTLAEILRDAGYQTGAMCANSAYLARPFNLDQGFDAYVDAAGSSDAWRPLGLSVVRRLPLPGRWRIERMLTSSERYYLLGTEINALAATWLADRHDRPFFLFLNYMEPHSPRLPLPGYRDLFPKSYARTFADLVAVNRGEETIDPAEVDAMIDAYDAEVRSLDDMLRDLFAQFDAWGALDNTVVVIVADHGEAFGEHGKFEHAISVYEEEIHIPLIVRAPGQTDGARVARRVHMADVAPTVLRLLGLDSPVPMEGGDLFNGGRALPEVAYFGPYERDFTEHAVYDGPYKLIVRSDAPPQLYNLESDPRETQNLVADEPETVARLEERFEQFVNRPGPRYSAGDTATDPETEERLRSLGYGQR